MRSSELLRRLNGLSASNALRLSSSTRIRCRCLHSSQKLEARNSRRSMPYGPYTNHQLPESELSVRHGKANKEYKAKSRKGLLRFTTKELEEMKKKYTPEQMAAVMAGEEAISIGDVADQGILHKGPMTLEYLDDFSQHRPTVDKRPEIPGVADPKTGKMPKLRWKDDHELVDDLEDWLDEQPDDGGTEQNWEDFLEKVKVYDSKANFDRARYSLSPELFPIADPDMQASARASLARANNTDESRDEFEALAKQTGFTVEQMKKFKIKFLVTRFVVNQTRLGKARSMYFLAIAGNGNGMLGLGEAKSQSPNDARKKVILDAIRNLTPIPRYENRTIYGNVKGKSGATELELFTRHPGFGSRGSALIWEICKMVGIKDISARVTRARNPMNIVKATFKALTSQRDPEEIALGRGRRMVDLRKVYYAGNNA